MWVPGRRTAPRGRSLSVVKVREWTVWALPRRVLVFVLGIDALALVAAPVVVAAVGRRPTPADAVVLGLLVVGLVVHGEVARHVERLRESEASDRPWVDLKSVWSFAGLLLLPIGLALVLVGVTFAYAWWRVLSRVPVHQVVFSAATVVLATAGARMVLEPFPHGAALGLLGPLGLAAISATALTRWTINFGLVCGVLTLLTPRTPWWRRFLAPVETTVGLGSLALGALVAGLADDRPWLIPVVLAPIMVMHRGLLAGQLTRAVHTDAKTGLATATRWQSEARRAVARGLRRGRSTAVLMVDLDDFKAVNDRWGHLAGDTILRAVADLLAETVPRREAVGRFGGEEFVVLLEDTDAEAVARVAERLRAGTRALEVPSASGVVTGLSVSIGTARTATVPAASLDALLLAADAALYAAKHAGRNRVCAAPARELPTGPLPSSRQFS